MKKKIALATLAMLPLTVNSASADGQVGIVTASSLNIRSGPSTSYSSISSAKKNDKVTILDSSNGWYKVRLNSGKEGWASSTYISRVSSDTSSESSNKKIVTASRLNMRSGASTSYRVITTINKGEEVDVISESNGWSKIKYDGRLGYVSSEYLADIKSEDTTTKKQKEVKATSLNVRSGASTSYSIIGSLKLGSKVDVISESNGWSKISFNGKVGYVSSMYLKDITQTPEVSPETPEKPNVPTQPDIPQEPEVSKVEKIVSATSLNVRSGASTNHSVIGSLKSGAKVEVISESNGWSKILFNGKDGYVSSQYLKDINSTPESKPETPQQPDDNTTTKVQKVVTASSLNVRSGAGTNYSKLGSLYKGNEVEVISESNGWSKISFNGKDGYVSSKYLANKDNNQPPTPTPTPNPGTGDSTNQGSNGATINNNVVNYTLAQHVDKQLERVSVGGNVIDSSKPRSMGNDGTSMMASARGFISADRSDLEHFLNPNNFKNSSKGMMQFLRIDSYKGGVTVDELNSYLNGLAVGSLGTNVFHNQGAAFINAAQKYNIDLVYLVSHSMWETAYGRSTLAQGQTITSFKGQPLESPVKVYNFFGIGAIDNSANVSGAEAAYSNGWTSVEATIDGSAKWIANSYIKSSKYNQNTIYKMKWNYDYTWHQYATDVNWANGISGIMNNLIKLYDTGSNLQFDIPVYK